MNMDNRYGFISGFLKAKEHLLLNEDDRKRIQAARDFDEMVKAATETFFGPSLVESPSPEKALEKIDSDTGEFVSITYRVTGGEIVALAVSQKFFELIRSGIYGYRDSNRVSSCGLTISWIFGEKEKAYEDVFFLSEIRNCAYRLKRIYEEEGIGAVEKRLPLEWRRFSRMVADRAGVFARKWQQMIEESHDAVTFFWCLRTGMEINQLTELLESGESLVCKYYKEAAKYYIGKPEYDTPEYYSFVAKTIYLENPSLKELALKLVEAKAPEEAERARDEFEEVLLGKAVYNSVSPAYVMWFFRKLFKDQEFIKENVLRLILRYGGVKTGATA